MYWYGISLKMLSKKCKVQNSMYGLLLFNVKKKEEKLYTYIGLLICVQISSRRTYQEGTSPEGIQVFIL